MVIGTPSAGPIADDNKTAAWEKCVAEYKKQPNAFPSPSLFAHGYYVNMTALLTALGKVNADVADGGGKLAHDARKPRSGDADRQGRLDKNRNAIADEFLTEVAKNADGTLYNKSSRSFRRSTRRWAFLKPNSSRSGRPAATIRAARSSPI